MKKLLMLATLCLASHALADNLTMNLKLIIDQNSYEQTFTAEEEEAVVLSCGEYNVEIEAISEEELVAANCKIYRGQNCNEEDLVANPVFISAVNQPVECELTNEDDETSMKVVLVISK